MAKKQTQLLRVLAALEDGPGTSGEIALATKMPLRHCSAYLCDLEKAGVVKVTGMVKPERCAHCGRLPGGGPSRIYALANQLGAA